MWFRDCKHAAFSTCDELSCHVSRAVTRLSDGLYGDVILFTAMQEARLAAGGVGGAAAGVAWWRC